MRIKVVLEDVDVGKKCCQNTFCVRSTEFELVVEFRPIKKDSLIGFPNYLLEKCLSWIFVSLCRMASPQKGKTKHHWGNKKSKC
jgi:hypothetical protein